MRVLLPKGKQRKLIEEILSKISVVDSARLCGVSERTIRDWRREKFLLQKKAMIKLCQKTQVSLPKSFKEKDDYWYVNEGASLGGKRGYLACLKKYGFAGGDPTYRKKQWYKWWHKKGKYRKDLWVGKVKSIKVPEFSEELAEFTGIFLGDGSITKSQIMIFINSLTDREYGYFIKNLIQKLFRVSASIYFRDDYSLMTITISRIKLVEFCNKKLGLKTGNKIKLQVDIPDWIKDNLEFEKACMRGLMDTDGCIFYECHTINGKKYCYPRLSFVTASEPLRDSVFHILNKLHLDPKIRNVNKRYVQIEDKEKIREYFEIIGSSNPKHLNRYYKSNQRLLF